MVVSKEGGSNDEKKDMSCMEGKDGIVVSFFFFCFLFFVFFFFKQKTAYEITV